MTQSPKKYRSSIGLQEFTIKRANYTKKLWLVVLVFNGTVVGRTKTKKEATQLVKQWYQSIIITRREHLLLIEGRGENT